MSYCSLTNINDYVYTFTSDDLAQVQKVAEEKLVQLVQLVRARPTRSPI